MGGPVALLWLAAGVGACQAPDTAVATLIRSQRGDEATLTVMPAPGHRLNARVPPALEFADGSVLRFTHGAVTADSAYFSTAPWARVYDGLPAQATLRVSYCLPHEAVCRSAAIPVDLPGTRT